MKPPASSPPTAWVRDRILPWLSLTVPYLAVMLLLMACQWIFAVVRAPAPGGEFYLPSSPGGAEVFRVSLDINGRALLPLGRTPGPIHLSRKDIPRHLLLRLPGYQERTVFLRSADLPRERRGEIVLPAVSLSPAEETTKLSIYSA